MAKKPLRRIKLPSKDGRPRKSETTVSVEQSHARQIKELPEHQKAIVIRSIKEGIPVGRIASYFNNQGWLGVQEKTFVQYLHAYKRLNRSEIDAYETDSIDDVVEGSAPELEEEDILQQMIRVQKRRIKIAHTFEVNTGLLNPNLHKDIAAVGDLADKLAKVRGKTAGAGRPEKDAVPITVNAKEQLSKVNRGEEAQRKLVNAIGQLGKLFEKKQATDEAQEEA